MSWSVQNHNHIESQCISIATLNFKTHNSFHISKLKKYIPLQIKNQQLTKLILVRVEGEMEYEVKEIFMTQMMRTRISSKIERLYIRRNSRDFIKDFH
jgi:hypothetical protein